MTNTYKWLIICAIYIATIQLSTAQQPVKRTIEQPAKTIKQPPAVIRKDIKTLPPKTTTTESEIKESVIQQAQPSNMDMLIDPEMLNKPLLVSQKYQKLLHDNTTYIDERGYHKMTFDIIKKQDGDFALVYGAATENLDIYTKGILFTLKPNLSQRGSATIITQFDEQLLEIRLQEFRNGQLSIAYTANTAACLNSAGQRDNNLSLLRYTLVRSDGKVESRNIDNSIGRIELKDIFQPAGCDDYSVIYNFNNKGKIGLANMYLGGNSMTCFLMSIPVRETDLSGNTAQMIRPGVQSISTFKGKFLIHTNAKLQTPIWDLGSNGITSGRALKPVWPLLLVDGFVVSNNHGAGCRYDNDPYTLYTADVNMNNILSIFPLTDGTLGMIEKSGNAVYFNTFDQQLNYKHPHVLVGDDVQSGSVEHIEIGNNKILFFHKTKTSGDKLQYHAMIYDWTTHEILSDHSEVLWEEDEISWEKIYKLLPIDDNRIIAFTIAWEDGHYKNQQTIEYRILTLNLN